ncbi:GDSL-type esterase/lipase family protein [Sporosarcina sp. CAU 1771]
MRRVLVSLIVFSICLSGCTSPIVKSTDVIFPERKSSNFKEWTIPNYFIPKVIKVVGIGDSLTQGVGDELKKGGYTGRITEEIKGWKGIKDIEFDNLAKKGRRSDQLLKQLEEKEIQAFVKEADIILLTIGGNDIMKVVKKNLFKLQKEPFYDELKSFDKNMDEVFGTIRALNDHVVIGVAGLYNPFSIVTDEATDFEDIIDEWNNAIEFHAVMDGKSCFVPVVDLFDSNTAMVYHTDFFHPNAKGYDSMAQRFLDSFEMCDLQKMSDGQLDM